MHAAALGNDLKLTCTKKPNKIATHAMQNICDFTCTVVGIIKTADI